MNCLVKILLSAVVKLKEKVGENTNKTIKSICDFFPSRSLFSAGYLTLETASKLSNLAIDVHTLHLNNLSVKKLFIVMILSLFLF